MATFELNEDDIPLVIAALEIIEESNNENGHTEEARKCRELIQRMLDSL